MNDTIQRICLNSLQTSALVSLLTMLNAANESIDIAPSEENYGSIRVTVWRKGCPVSWQIALDGDANPEN